MLGPALFITFINGMPKVVEKLLKIFANDKTVFALITSGSKTPSEQHEKLQICADAWQLRFNAAG